MPQLRLHERLQLILRKEVMKLAAKKTTGKKAATSASNVLRDGRTGKASKAAAGSALSQRESKAKKSK